jgi:hypothetical protein
MERPHLILNLKFTRTLTGCGLGLTLLMAGGGCRNLRSEVPPGKPFAPPPEAQAQAQAIPPIGFSNAPHPADGPPGTGGGNGIPGMTSGVGQLGTPAPGANAGTYGLPTDNAYGPPGSSPAAATSPNALPSASASPAAMPPMALPGSASDPSVGIPQAGTGPIGPAADPTAPAPGISAAPPTQ